MGLKLFDDGDASDDDFSKIEINKEFARRYEHNKKREDLQKYNEMKKKGIIDESSSEGDGSSSESEEEEYDSDALEKHDLEFFDALIKVKNQDPILKQKDASLFGESDEGDDEEENGNGKEKKSNKKAMYLKDVVAKHLIEEGPDFQDKELGKKSYSEEQEELKRAFLDAAGEVEDEEGEFLKVRETEDRSRGKREKDDDGGEEFEKKLDEYFGGGNAETDGNAKFLKEYFMNKMWIDKDEDMRIGEQELDGLSEDEDLLEKQEEYEKGYNFRFEENAGDRVLGHSRIMEGSVRKKANARKEQRKSKEERMKIAEMQREEELKHMKNLKKEEMEKKLRKIAELAGIDEDDLCLLNAKDLDKDFDPEEYDKLMKAAFDDKYYNDEDANPGKIEKPDFGKEDELLGLPKDWDMYESGDGFLAARERILKLKEDMNSDGEGGEDEEEDDEEELVSEEVKRKRRRKISALKKAKEEMLEEYYKLDHEDTIGDLKIRFPYAKITPNRYGLSTDEIIMMDDKELNQYVPLKKIAPYHEQEWKVHNSKRHQQKMKNKELREKLDDHKNGKKKRTKELLRREKLDDQNVSKKKRPRQDAEREKLDDQNVSKKKRPREDAEKPNSSLGGKADGKSQPEISNSGPSNLSRQARRRLQAADLKLSHSRLLAYGKISAKGKRKRKGEGKL